MYATKTRKHKISPKIINLVQSFCGIWRFRALVPYSDIIVSKSSFIGKLEKSFVYEVFHFFNLNIVVTRNC